MRAARIIPALVLIALVSAVVPFVLFGTKFRRFQHQSAKYHAEVAAACDLMLAHYPVGTNSRGIEISVTDAALPQSVRSLHPIKIRLAPNWAWIWVDGSHTDGLNITWEPQDEMHTNIWNLVIGNGEGPSKVVYAVSR
jgi:hypothetical protein